MRITNHHQWLASVVAAALLLAAPALAEARGKGKRGGDHEKHFEKLMEKLELTADQKEAISKIRADKKKDIDNLRDEARAAGKKFQAEMEKVESKAELSGKDKERLKRLHRKKMKAKSTLKHARFAMGLDIREKLTPDQRKQFRELKEKHKGKRGKMRRQRSGGKAKPRNVA